ncbi:MAG: hypothetical protein GY705_04010 [Bacteroidetes bacterium]|nr:hypothetical protein [Bacteroidota bacterium]
MKKVKLFSLVALCLFIFSCDKDDYPTPTKQFRVTIENVFEGKDYFQSGAFGAIPPGESLSFSFRGGKGHYLQFATMYVQTNDIFVSPDDSGLALYDDAGNPLNGNITSMVSLWDAGTEVNEEPGVGPNQAPRQTGANTGADENGNVVLLSNTNDGFSYPNLEDLVDVSITHDGGTLFTLTIENISMGSSVPSPFAPGVWVVHSSGQYPLFQTDKPASSGLEGLSEDGANDPLEEEYANNAGLVSPFAPGAYSIGESNDIFSLGSQASTALESLAEDGDPSGHDLFFNTPDGTSGPAPIFPGETYSFTFSANADDNMSMAIMLVQTNDWFLGLDAISLYNSSGTAITGDITSSVSLFDAGTEQDEYSGAGNDQAPRQSGPNTGAAENGNVTVESNPHANVPAVNSMVRVTLEEV